MYHFGEFEYCANCYKSIISREGLPWIVYKSDLLNKYPDLCTQTVVLDQEMIELDFKRQVKDLVTKLRSSKTQIEQMEKYYQNLLQSLFFERLR